MHTCAPNPPLSGHQRTGGVYFAAPPVPWHRIHLHRPLLRLQPARPSLGSPELPPSLYPPSSIPAPPLLFPCPPSTLTAPWERQALPVDPPATSTRSAVFRWPLGSPWIGAEGQEKSTAALAILFLLSSGSRRPSTLSASLFCGRLRARVCSLVRPAPNLPRCSFFPELRAQTNYVGFRPPPTRRPPPHPRRSGDIVSVTHTLCLWLPHPTTPNCVLCWPALPPN
jgi:hypothetical protein